MQIVKKIYILTHLGLIGGSFGKGIYLAPFFAYNGF